MSGMMVREAERSAAKPLIGLYAESGTGKTLSALFLARGYVDEMIKLLGLNRPGVVGMIESESGRGEAHNDTRVGDSFVGGFKVISIWDHDSPDCAQHSKNKGEGKCTCSHQGQPFRPERYGQAIALAERMKWDALLIDSSSHEWEGIGGVLHWAAENQKSGKKGPLVWQQPKIDHQRYFTGKLLQTSIPLVIVCMRAKYPMEEEKVDGKKEWVRSKELSPKQSEDILFEMFVHGWIDREHRFQGTKYTRPELAGVLKSGQPISNATGAALARWAADIQAPAVSVQIPGQTSVTLPTLASVVASFKAATTVKELQAAGAIAQRLSEEDKALAMVAYKEELARLKAAQDKPAEREPGSDG